VGPEQATAFERETTNCRCITVVSADQLTR
jgi:hypothetical protein